MFQPLNFLHRIIPLTFLREPSPPTTVRQRGAGTSLVSG